MRLSILSYLGAFFIVSLIGNAFASSSNMLSYDDAWNVSRFNGKNLQDIVELYPMPGTVLSKDQKQCLLESKTLYNLKTLDLSNQEIDDKFIEALCNQPTFSRIINLDLSGNPDITDLSLKYLLESNTLGSVRDLPQISGTYGSPSSEIYITTRDTAISPEAIQHYHSNPRFDFVINYLHPITHTFTAPSAKSSIKWLRFS
ncbi:hypothetical protein IM40_10905 (plasmid) [Candidatus Paracaedimonas acanthamoebae]|nr:hypothetical protein IM40_10905 [Candidatus Paracaedimonas acanthamoebae]